MLVAMKPASPMYMEGFYKVSKTLRQVVQKPGFHKLEVSVKRSDDVAWVDDGRIMNQDGTMSHIAVEVMVDVQPLSVFPYVDTTGLTTLHMAPAVDLRVGGDARFDPKILQIELSKFQFVVNGETFPLADAQCAARLAKEALDAYFQMDGRSFFEEEVAKECRRKGADFDGTNASNLAMVEGEVYNYYLDKTAKQYHKQIVDHVSRKTLVATYLRLHGQLQDGEAVCRTQSYLNGRRLLVATVAGNTSCAAVAGGGMMGVFQDEPRTSPGGVRLRPYEKTVKYTAAVKCTTTKTEYSKLGLVEAMTAHVDLEGAGMAPENGEVAEIHPLGVSGVRFFGGQCYLTLQCKGVPRLTAPTKGLTRGGGGRGLRSLGAAETTVVRQAAPVKVMAMNLSPGTKVEKTPLPSCSIPPWDDEIVGATCFFITNAKLDVGPDMEATPDAVLPSLRQAVDVFDGLADAVSKGVGFQSLSASACIVREADMTPAQVQVKMEVEQVRIQDLLQFTNEQVLSLQYKTP